MTSRLTPWLSLLLALTGAACDGGAAGSHFALETCELPDASPQGLVRVTAEGGFSIDGKAYLPRGVNSYPLLQHVGNGQHELVSDILDQAVELARPLVRTPAFLDGGENPARIRDADGSLREEGLLALDQVLALAREKHVRLLLVLTNNWADFGGAEAVLEMVAPGEDLPKNAFWSDPRALAAQLAYQRALATRVNTLNGQRYADDDSIFAWELVNEARCEASVTPELCDEGTLARWAKAMGDGLRASGVQQPIAWGGAGYLSEHGEDLRSIAHAGAVDVLTLHLYAEHVTALVPVPRFAVAMDYGAQVIRERAQVAREAGLPLLLEEVNWKPDTGGDRDGERATVLDYWLEVAGEEGVGALPWMIGEHGRTDYDGYLVRPSDTASVHVLGCE